ncbi:unnamed protein product [Rotaria socialis]|uniref:DRBM domain-containing protein n=1 Tax=Rotaria socialis TaxID=392032 RepID=A0A820B198_9BILA|nr:unnamed protein product [Rotaria socialis]
MNNNENFNNRRTQAAFMFNRLIMRNQRFPLTEPSYINQKIDLIIGELFVTATYDLISETGPGHCKKFEVRLTVANKTSIGMETSIKRAQQTAEQALATTTLKKPEKSRHKSKSSRTSRIKKVPSNDPQKNLPQQQVPVEINQQQINPIHENTFEILLNKKHDEISEQKSHSNWFTRSIFHHNDTLIVLRLLRDLQYKQTPLSCLNIWCLILIVHKCQNQPVNSILTLFPAVFTYMNPANGANYLTNNQRSAVTPYAQNTVRLIACE